MASLDAHRATTSPTTDEATQEVTHLLPDQERWASLERWAEYLCVPVKYVRERMREVLETRKGTNAEGKKYDAYGELDIAERIPEYTFVREMELVGKTQEEIRSAVLMRVLIIAGYPDRRSLELVTASVFAAQDFPPLGKGFAFYAHVTGKRIRYFSKNHVLEVAKVAGLPILSEERLQKFRKALAQAEYPDRRSLELINPRVFQDQHFLLFGKGRKFYSQVTGKRIGNGTLTKNDLLQIADVLALPMLSQERIQQFRKVLENAGYPDRRSLECTNPNIFRSKDFFPFGKGKEFHAHITGDRSQNLNKHTILQIADVLALPVLSQERIQQFRGALAKAGYQDLRSLEHVNPDVVVTQNFPPFGKGKAFYAAVIGKPVVRGLTRNHLLEIARALDLPIFNEERMQQFQEVLEKAGYPDRRSLEVGYPHEFSKQDLPPFGKGKAFYVWVTGKRQRFLAKHHLLELADVVFPKDENISFANHD